MEKDVQKFEQNKRKKERGASMVEYALLVALIAVVAIAAIRFMGQTVSTQFSDIGNSLT